MRIKNKLILVGLLLLSVFILKSSFTIVGAESDPEKAAELAKKIAEYQAQVASLQAKASTLSNQISQFNAQIQITELKIEQTEDQISLLAGRIGTLTDSVSSLTSAFDARVLETYKLSRIGGDAVLVASAGNLKDALTRYQYLVRLQAADQQLLTRLKKANDGYLTQKSQLTELNNQLAAAKVDLGSQKTSKAKLLSVTQNDEKKYQSLLASAKAEYEAIQAIIAGKGDETEAGHVADGARIANVIQGSSCNSQGSHLHFIVAKNGNAENPFGYLKPGIESKNCSGSSCEASDGDSFNPSGSWNWPINSPIQFNQGYGVTWAVRHDPVVKLSYNFHNGIDINSGSSNEVKAVHAGTLYRGGFSGRNGCRLRYVRVKHDDSDLSTFYLHINY